MALNSSSESLFRGRLHSLESLLAHSTAAVVQVVTLGVDKYQADLVSLRAMGLTYTTLLSFVPFLASTQANES